MKKTIENSIYIYHFRSNFTISHCSHESFSWIAKSHYPLKSLTVSTLRHDTENILKYLREWFIVAPLQPLKIPKYIPFSITRLPFRERVWVWSFRALDPIRDVAIASISSWNQVSVLRTIPSKEREKGLKKEKNKTRVASQKRQRETNIKESKREERMEWKKLNVKGVKKFQRSIDRPALENGFNSRAYAAFRDRWLDFFKNPAGQTITGGPLSSIGLTGYWPLFSLSLSLSPRDFTIYDACYTSRM